MTSTQARLLTIGEFSRLALISVRMLRHYDEHALLQPTLVDPFSAYRYYSHEQLVDATRIRRLRDLGCQVSRIGELLPLFDRPDDLGAALEAERATLRREADQAAARLVEVDRLITHCKEFDMSIPVTLTTEPARIVAALRGTIPTYSDEGLLWQGLMDGLGTEGAALAQGLPMATFYDEEYREADIDVEVAIALADRVSPTGNVRCIEIGERQVVSAVLNGSFDGMGDVMAALGAWMATAGYVPCGPMYNEYIVGAHQNPDPAAWVTRACIPVKVA